MALKILVILLGVLLMGAAAFLCFTVAARAGRQLDALADCKDATFHLPAIGAAQSIVPQGANVQVTLVGPGKTQVLTVDRCSGKLLQTLTIAP